MLKQEGPLGFFKGLGPQLFGLVPSWAIYFSVYDTLKPILTNMTNGIFFTLYLFIFLVNLKVLKIIIFLLNKIQEN